MGTPAQDRHIDNVLTIVRNFWLDHPHFRLGQILIDAAGVNDIFYTSDSDLMLGICSLTGEYYDEGREEVEAAQMPVLPSHGLRV